MLQELLDVTRELLKELDAQPSAPETDELREKFRIVKVPCYYRVCLTLAQHLKLCWLAGAVRRTASVFGGLNCRSGV